MGKSLLYLLLPLIVVYSVCSLAAPKDSADRLNLTSTERQWLKEHGKIRIGVDPAWPPIEYIAEDGAYQGIASDYVKHVSQMLGVEMIPVPSMSWQQVMENAKKGNIDVLPAATKTHQREAFLLFTKPHLKFPFVVFVRNDHASISGLEDLVGKRVAVEKNYVSQEWLAKDFPRIDQLLVETTRNGLSAVSTGRADAYVGNLVTSSHVIDQHGLTNLKIAAPTTYVNSLAFGVRKDWPELAGILNKALNSISREQAAAIRKKWMSVRFEHGTDTRLLWTVLAIAFALLAFTVAWLAQIRRQRERLRISEERYRNATSAVSESIWEWNVVSGKRHFTPALFQAMNYQVEDIPATDTDWEKFIHPDDRAGRLQALRAHENDSNLRDRELELEYRLRRADGSYAHVAAKGRATRRDIQGRALARIGTIEDITEKKEAQAKIRRLTQAVDQSPALVVITDPTTQIEYVNQKIQSLTGYSAGEVLGKPAIMLASPNIDQQALDSLRKAVGEKRPWTGELMHQRKDGSEFWVSVSISPIFNENGELTHFISIDEDIDERKTAEENLRDSELQLKTLINALPLAIVVADSQGTILFDNPQAAKELGSESSLVGRSTFEFYADAGRREEILSLLKTEGEIEREHVRFRTDKGTVIDCLISVIPVKFGGESTVLAVLVNLTKRIRLERELAEAKEAADRASRFKSNFLANMSHEIRTPMNAIIGMSHLALQTDSSVKQRDYLDKIQIACRSLLSIINDILDFSKIEAGHLHVEAVNFRLDHVLENTADLFRLKAEEKGIELLLDIKPDVPMALIGDPLRLGQVLTNLTGNALKFTKYGEIIIGVESVHTEGSQVQMGFSVADTGIGIAADKASKLFDSFFQVDASTTRTHGGTGLGLAISKRLVNMMNGEITVESEVGKGSFFRFTSRFGIQEGIAEERPMPSPDLRGMRVLVVDDNAVACHVLCEQLTSFSFKVTTADNARQAIEILESSENRFDLVIMDWLMPGMNGIEAARIIKQSSKLVQIPLIIMVTAHGQDRVLKQAEDLGLDGYLLKPVSPSTLFDTIIKSFGAGLAPSEVQRKSNSESNPDKISATVLLAEDNLINQQVAGELLGSFGITVDYANDGVEAVEKVTNGNYDLLVMDIQMPEMDGLEATRLIRRRGMRNLPIIAMTAHAMVGDREKSLAAGMNDHITKPIDPGELYRTLRRWLLQEISKPDLGFAGIYKDAVNLPDYTKHIDYEAGVKRVGGNRRLFKKLLFEFYKGHKLDDEVLNRAVIEHRRYDAMRIAHTIKGISGNIGANQLFQHAQALESLLNANPSEAEMGALRDFTRSFRNVMDCLAQLENDGQPRNEILDDPQIDPEELVLEVDLLLRQGDCDVLDKSRTLIDFLQQSDAREEAEALKTHVGSYNFDQARQTLISIAERLNLNCHLH